MKNDIKSQLVSLKNNNPWLLLLWHEQLRYRGKQNLKRYSDEEAINRLYFNFAGVHPDLDNPTTFSEKQQWLKLNYRNPLMTRCADKYEARNFLKEQGYEHILSKLIGYYQSMDEFDIQKLPNKFVLKASHGSGWNLICKDKNKINWTAWKLILKSWLKSNIYWPGREWPYKDMPHGIICEGYMEDKSGQLMDYKFFCFNGQPHFIQANKGRGTALHAQNFYDLDWKFLPFGKELEPIASVDIERPHCFDEMIVLATNLSKHFPFVRIDFYEVANKVIFGEFTFYPKSGLPDFTPIKYDKIIGDKLELPSKYKDNERAN